VKNAGRASVNIAKFVGTKVDYSKYHKEINRANMVAQMS
jgi:hypothetical protein